jgi:nanoRNase/pAp phosphatase (c-di-AMP/oligoRNAs hydrolase)
MFLVQQNQKNAKEIALQAQFGTWPWSAYRTAVVNAPYILASDVGEILYQRSDVDIAVIWFERNDGKIQISLRSKPGPGLDEGPDVGTLAMAFPGGGGHKHAAGIPPTLKEGRAIIDRILDRK